MDPVRTAEDELPPLVVTPFDRLKFLVIDDSVPCLDIIQSYLRKAEAGSIMRADSVFAAVRLLAEAEDKIDCIVCNHQMKGMTGLALLQRLRAGRNGVVPRDIRFIMVTAEPNEDLVRTAFQLDVNGFLTKPFRMNLITKAIHLAFGRPLRLKPAVDYARIALPA